MKKHIFMSMLLAACSGAAFAQSVNVATPISDNAAADKKVVYVNSQNRASFIKMQTKENIVYFTNIDPAARYQLHVTNDKGREMLQMKITAKYNGFDITKLSKGIYFVTLIDEENESRKAFTLNL
ncbi:T9SS type A sorting domain-containing protein [Chitinophagaceae bacterium MMS25-I14]